MEPLEPRLLLDGSGLLITEFMAENDRAFADASGNFPDWIEIQNTNTTAVDLDGWYLSDNTAEPRQWRFPDVTIEGGDYLVVFASGKNQRDPAGELHTNFKLANEDEDVVLVLPNGVVEHGYLDYPDQYKDISYGLARDVSALVAADVGVSFLVPSSAGDGTDGQGNSWTELDFDDSEFKNSMLANPLLITEFSPGDDDWVEIQNVSSYEAQTAGWSVAVNWASPAPDTGEADINRVGVIEWVLPETIPAGEVLFRTDDTSGGQPYWGENIWWKTADKGWVMIVDNVGAVRDFVVWGYSEAEIESMETTVNTFLVRPRDAWPGAAIESLPSSDDTRSGQRVGTADTDGLSDFVWHEPQSPWQVNVGLDAPFAGTGGPPAMAGLGFTTIPPGHDDANFRGALRTNLEADAKGVNASVWTRIPFEVDDPAAFSSLQLQMKYEDGFVAYINGQEVARKYAPATPQWNSTSTQNRSNPSAFEYESFSIPLTPGLLQAGENMLAIHGLNNSINDGDFLIAPMLRAAGTEAIEHYMDQSTPGGLNESPMSSEEPKFSAESGTYVSPFTLEITSDVPDAVIRYTMDGSVPTDESPSYEEPITIRTSTQIRAQVYEPGMKPGPLKTRSFVFLSANVRNFSSRLPIVVVDTFGQNGFNANTYSPAYVAIFEPGATSSSLLNEPDLGTRAGLEFRGSSTQGNLKKNYKLEAWGEDNDDRDISPLGMPSQSDWILYAPYQFDRSLNRNAFIYELSNQVGRWAARCKFVEVFVNTGAGALNYGDYQGVYVLMEKIKLDDNRVDIEPMTRLENSPPEVTGGYIFKKDRPDPGEASFSAGGMNSLVWVYPKASNPDIELVVTSQQRSYLINYLNNFNSVLNSGNYTDPVNGYAKYIDVAAWIDHNWLNLLPKNPDSFRLSGYHYKDRNDKLVAGPIWDFDRSMGPDNDGRASNPSGWNPTGDGTNHFIDSRTPWWGRLFRDSNFGQAWIDRWYELRQDQFSVENMHAIVDAQAAEITASAAGRNFQKWTAVRPTNGNWQGEIEHLKQWLEDRGEWIDSQFLTAPLFNSESSVVQPGFQLTLNVPAAENSTIYYTLDGTDPRAFGGGISPDALIYDGTPIAVNDTTLVKARAWDGQPWRMATIGPSGGWSGLHIGDFVVGNPAAMGSVVISELNYHPYNPSAAELAAMPLLDDSDFEFVELMNVSGLTVELANARFTNGIDFTFDDDPSLALTPGERIVVASNPDAFTLRYGTGVTVVGPYTGLLDNGGERIALEDRFGETIVEFRFNDANSWPGRADGAGATLELIDPNAAPTTLPESLLFFADSENWQSSSEMFGSPGRAGAEPLESIVINEVLSRSNPLVETDWIELFNPTDQTVDIGGWFLSDSRADYRAYRIPDGTTMAPGAYRVFDEYDFTTFALSSLRGDDVWLMEADPDGTLRRFADHVEFGAAADGETIGSWPNGGGTFYPMTSPTRGTANSGPRVGPVTISEVMYNSQGLTAQDSFEFVEIFNPTSATVDLTDWRIRKGIDFNFADGTELAPGGTLVVVPFDDSNLYILSRFRSFYGIDDSVAIVGGFDGLLDNDGEKIQLQRPGVSPPTDQDFIPRLLEDEVRYYDIAPWPTGPAGSGESMTRVAVGTWGNDPSSWISLDPSPGRGPRHPGDADNNGATDLSDFNIWNANKFQMGMNWEQGDFNGDGGTDISDFNIWNAYKFTTIGGAAPAPPVAHDAVLEESAELPISDSLLAELAWISQNGQTSKDSQEARTAEEAVDRLLASYWP